MCRGCWIELGAPTINTPEIHQCAADIKEHYETLLGGGGLHVLLDDWNLDDEFVNDDSRAYGWSNAADRIVSAMRPMSIEERASALALAEGYWK